MSRIAASILLTVACVLILSGANAPSPAASSPTEVVRNFFAAFNQHDVTKVLTYYADDVVMETPDYPQPQHGKQAIRKDVSNLFTQMPDIHDEVKSLIANGDNVAVEFVSTGTVKGKDGKAMKFALKLSDFFTVKNGKIVRDATYFDRKAGE